MCANGPEEIGKQMERRYQVFVSSTFVDLQIERSEVIQALLELDCIPASMEMFPASNDDAWSLIQRVIRDCDYYVVIVGGRYGSVSHEGISFTEREYDYAIAQEKPVLGFVLRNPDEIPAGKTEKDPSLARKLTAFREKVMQKTVREWSTPHELGSVVSRSLVRVMKEAPSEGWVKGRYAMTPESQAELSDLRAAKLELQQLIDRKALPMDTTELAQGDEKVELEFRTGTTAFGEFLPQYRVSMSPTWNYLFGIIGPAMLDEASERTLGEKLHNALLSLLSIDRSQIGPPVVETTPILDILKIQFSSLGLIDKGTKRRATSDKDTYWRLTDSGERLLYSLSAFRKAGTDPKLGRPTHVSYVRVDN